MSEIAGRLHAFRRLALKMLPAGQLLRGGAIVALMTLTGKSVSFVKDMMVAGRYGAAPDLDCFLLAQSCLAFVGMVLGAGLPEAFLPAHADARQRFGRAHAQRLAGHSLGLHLGIVLVASLIIAFLAESCGRLVAGTSNAAQQAQVAGLLRALLPFFVFYAGSFHLSALLRSEKKFMLYAAAPLAVPLGVVLVLLAKGTSADVRFLVWGTNVGAGVQFVLLFWNVSAMRGQGNIGQSDWHPIGKSLRQVARDALPCALAFIVMGGSSIVDQAMAARLEAGSVAMLTYAEKLCGLLGALLGAVVGDVLSPFFADWVAQRDWKSLRRCLWKMNGGIVLWTLGSGALLCWLAPWVVALLFERGEFGPHETARVAEVLRVAVWQMPFALSGVMVMRLVVALRLPAVSLVVAVGTFGLNILLNAWFMSFMGLPGIALATVLVHVAACGLLHLIVLRKLNILGRSESPNLEAGVAP